MKLLIYVMNQPHRLKELMRDFADNGIKGATVLEAQGMAQFLKDTLHPLYTERLSGLVDFNHHQPQLILLIIPDEQVNLVYQLIGRISGDFQEPNSGIAFTLALDSLRGYKG